MHIRLPYERYSKDEQLVAFNDRLLERVRQLPGVESAAVASGLPMMDNLSVTTYRVEGEAPPADAAQIPETDLKGVSEDYFRCV